MKTYVQLTYEQRCQIYAFNNTDLSQQKIADAVGVSQSAISRELKRNRGKCGYRYQQAQSKGKKRALTPLISYGDVPRENGITGRKLICLREK
ncbi:MAG: IS30 family transposase [Candidatus Endobugula sp.]|jgi:IS30 family transposase